MKIKESLQKDKYLDLVRVLNILWNVKMPVIPIAVDALRTVPKGLEKGLVELETRVPIEMIRAKLLLRFARIQRSILDS